MFSGIFQWMFIAVRSGVKYVALIPADALCPAKDVIIIVSVIVIVIVVVIVIVIEIVIVVIVIAIVIVIVIVIVIPGRWSRRRR